jgi:hypothetical protein
MQSGWRMLVTWKRRRSSSVGFDSRYINRKAATTNDRNRGDILNFGKYTYRKQFSETAKYIL